MQGDVETLADLLVASREHRIDDFVENWMLLPERVRKSWAQIGAIFSRAESDRVDDMATGTFDPGNWCYDKGAHDSWVTSWEPTQAD